MNTHVLQEYNYMHVWTNFYHFIKLFFIISAKNIHLYTYHSFKRIILYIKLYRQFSFFRIWWPHMKHKNLPFLCTKSFHIYIHCMEVTGIATEEVPKPIDTQHSGGTTNTLKWTELRYKKVLRRRQGIAGVCTCVRAVPCIWQVTTGLQQQM